MKISKAGMRFVIGVFGCLGFFAVICALIFIQVPAQNGDIIKIMAGFLGGVLTSIVSFYFGDSDGRTG